MKKWYYLSLVLILYFIYIPPRFKKLSEDNFLMIDINSKKITHFSIEFYDLKNDLRLVLQNKIKSNNKYLTDSKDIINGKETFHIVFDQEGEIVLKSIKIKKHKNLLSISTKELKDYFLLNKNVNILNDSTVLIKKNFPGKARIISKAIVAKTLNLHYE